MSVDKSDEIHARVLELMMSEDITFGEAKARVTSEMNAIDTGVNVDVDLKKEIQTIAFADYRNGKFGWYYPDGFLRELKKRYPNTNFKVDEIKKACDKLSSQGILYSQLYENGMKYVFDKKNLK